MQATPPLCALVLFMWALQAATGFPPGAITVVTIQKTSYKMVLIPTLNASFVSAPVRNLFSGGLSNRKANAKN